MSHSAIIVFQLSVILCLVYFCASFAHGSRAGVRFCADMFADDCSKLRYPVIDSTTAAAALKNDARSTVSHVERVLADNSELEEEVEEDFESLISERPEVVYSGNVALSRGSCATSCEWFGNVTSKEAYCKSCDPKLHYILYEREDITSEQKHNQNQCYNFPADLHNGMVPLEVFNMVKKQCAAVAQCKCVERAITSANEIDLLVKVLRQEVDRNMKLFNEIVLLLQEKASSARHYINQNFAKLKSIRAKKAEDKVTKRRLVEISKSLVKHCREKMNKWSTSISEALSGIQTYQRLWQSKMLKLIEDKKSSMTSVQASAVMQQIRVSCKKIRIMFNDAVISIENQARECVGDEKQGNVLVSELIKVANKKLTKVVKK